MFGAFIAVVIVGILAYIAGWVTGQKSAEIEFLYEKVEDLQQAQMDASDLKVTRG